MALLGPFEPAPRLAAGVSGGADSMALALLAADWACHRGGSLCALIVDHGLRPESGEEAAAAAMRLGEHGIDASLLRLHDLIRGPGLAERAREARYAALAQASAALGILHLLLGHHAADQAETVLIRALGGSGPSGMAAMSPLVETRTGRLLRPLLSVPPVRLRATLQAAGVAWAEDPSNADTHALRPRLRLLRRDENGTGAATSALETAARAAGAARRERELAVAGHLAEHCAFRPEGFALIHSAPVEAGVLAALIQAVAGTPFPPPTAAVAALAASPRPATLAGTRLLPAGRLGPGWLLVREEAAMAPQVPARAGAVWDGRFRVMPGAALTPGVTLGPLGAEAARLRRHSPLPAAVLRTLPALRQGEELLAVPHLHYPGREASAGFRLVFSPSRPVAPAPFVTETRSRAIGDA